MQRPPSTLPLGRIFLIGALAPTIFACVDHGLLIGVRNRTAPVPFVFAVYVAQVAVLGLLTGHFIQRPALRWILYGWGWLFLDLQTSVAVLEAYRRHEVALLADSLFAAQIGLLTIWAMLGRQPYWALRYPAAMILAMPFILFVNAESWSGFVIHSLVLAAICLLLAWQGFRLSDANPPEPIGARTTNSRMQFGVRDVLIWTTTVAVGLALLRAFDLLSLDSLRPLLGKNWLLNCSAAGIVAIVLITAMWAGLGEGEVWGRWPMPFIIGLMGALVLIVIRWSSPPPTLRRRVWHSPSSFDQLVQEGWVQVALWLCLAGGLLFAGLLFFRAQGVRLSRDRLPTRRVLQLLRQAHQE